MPDLTGASDDSRPLALPSHDDRGTANAATAQQIQAAFDHALGVLGETPQPLDDVGALAALVSALPPEMGLRIGATQIVDPDARPRMWITTVVPSIIVLAEPAETHLRDAAGSESYVPTPGLQLTEWLVPDGDETAGEPHAADPYERLREACDTEGPAAMITAGSNAITSIAELLGDHGEGPLACLPDDSEAGLALADALHDMRDLAARLAVLATQTEAEEDERYRSEQ